MYGNSNMNQSGNYVNAASNPYVQNQFVQNQQQQQQMMPSGGGGYGGGRGGGGIVPTGQQQIDTGERGGHLGASESGGPQFAGWGKPPCTALVCGARDGGYERPTRMCNGRTRLT